MTSFFSTKVSLYTSPGDDPRRDRLRECDRRDLGEGERTDRPSHSRTDRGASDIGTVSILSVLSVFSYTVSPPWTLGLRTLGLRTLGFRTLGAEAPTTTVGVASIKRVVVTASFSISYQRLQGKY